jgi:hypothetical protein
MAERRPDLTDRMKAARGATRGDGAGHERAKAAKDKGQGSSHGPAPKRPERVTEKRSR